jgi:type VI protein secretion system component Hcp
MRKTVIWAAVAVVLLAIPVVLAVMWAVDDESSSKGANERRSAALVQPQPGGVPGSTMAIPGITSSRGVIDVLSWSWGGSNSSSAEAPIGKVNMQDFHFTKTTDETSDDFFTYLASGDVIPSLALTVNSESAEKPTAEGTYTLTGVRVTSVSQGKSSGGRDPGHDQISLNFAGVQYRAYRPTPEGGSELAGVFDWTVGEVKQ